LLIEEDAMTDTPIRVKKLVWFETHQGMWLRAEALGQVYEVPNAAGASAKKAACQRKFDAFVRSALEFVET
jgi:G3E family GTPase